MNTMYCGQYRPGSDPRSSLDRQRKRAVPGELPGQTLSLGVGARTVSGAAWGRYRCPAVDGRANKTRLILGCIEADVCK